MATSATAAAIVIRQQISPGQVRCDVCDMTLNSRVVYEQHILGQRHAKMLAKKQGQQKTPGHSTTTADIKVEPTASKLASYISFDAPSQQPPLPLPIVATPLAPQQEVPQMQPQKPPRTAASEQSTCTVCNVALSSQIVAEQHYKGSRHQKKLKQLQQSGGQIPTTTSTTTETSTAAQPAAEATNDVTTQAVTNNNKPEFKCQVCDLSLLNKEQLESHYAGKKHAKKLGSMSSVVASSVASAKLKEIAAKEDEKFAHLNIAWDKYRISDELKICTNNKYDFYCVLCNKYMQGKMQLVDHLKSKKHHQKIYEKRAKENGLTTSSIAASNAVSKLAMSTKSIVTGRAPINFVPASSSSTTTESLTAQQQQPTSTSNSTTMAVYPSVNYYQNNKYQMQPRYNTNRVGGGALKRKGDPQQPTNYGDDFSHSYMPDAKYAKNSANPFANDSNNNNNTTTTSSAIPQYPMYPPPFPYGYSGYGYHQPMDPASATTAATTYYQSLAAAQQQQQVATTTTPTTYDMFSNISYMQYAAAYSHAAAYNNNSKQQQQQQQPSQQPN